MTANWRETFGDPGAEYRGAPFRSWNGKLDPDELRRQVRDMKEHGMGGFFMHSRSGLQTPYFKGYRSLPVGMPGEVALGRRRES